MEYYYRQFPGLPNLPFPIPGWPNTNTGMPGAPTGMPGTGGGSPTGGTPPPSQNTINMYQYLLQNPSKGQEVLTSGTWVGSGTGTTFGVGCDRRWTIMLLNNGRYVLMWVLTASAFGNTTGIIFPAFTFASFPTSSILAYSC